MIWAKFLKTGSRGPDHAH